MNKSFRAFLLILITCTLLSGCSAAAPDDSGSIPSLMDAGIEPFRPSLTPPQTDEPATEVSETTIPAAPTNEVTAAEMTPTPAPSQQLPSVTNAIEIDDNAQWLQIGKVWVYQVTEEGEFGTGEYQVKSDIFVRNDSGDILWHKEFFAAATELETISPAFACRDMLYIQVQGELFAFDAITGEERFSVEGIGASNNYAFGPGDILYISGFYGPFLSAVSPGGELLWQIVDAAGVWWPYDVTVADDIITVLLDGSDDGLPYIMLCSFDGTYEIVLDAESTVLYENERLGFSLEIPAFWRGHYNIIDFDSGIRVEFRGESEQSALIIDGEVAGLFMFAITNDPAQREVMDSFVEIGEAGGSIFYYCTGTDSELSILIESDDSLARQDYELVLKMQESTKNLLASFRAL